MEPSPVEGSSSLTSTQKKAHKEALEAFVKANKEFMTWAKEDDKCLRLMQLKIADKLQYLVCKTAKETWESIKSQFDVSGPTAIFVDFRSAINFKFDERKDPSIQVAELNTRINHLATHRFALDEHIQAMIILSRLPQSWDSVQGAILANTPMSKLNINAIMPVLQEEWQCHQARHNEQKSSHLARMNIHGGPQGQQNNYTPQAGSSFHSATVPSGLPVDS